jgi:predicted AlkP superfamily phosphohydrolase/phosphomutase
VRWILRVLWPGVPLGLLLLPTATAWLDLARTATGERYAYRRDAPRRVVVLGFDGVDPNILRGYMADLPAVAALARDGTLLPCRTTNPPESPVAWATFATGLNPGAHGIFDFVRRDLSAADPYRPINGMVKPIPPELGPLGFPVRPPRAVNLRGGEGFWEPVARMGYRVSTLRMPLTFPAGQARGGELLCGLGVPDLRATQGSYTLFAAGRDAWNGYTEFGGLHVKIYPRSGVARTRLDGPLDPRDPAAGRRLSVPVSFTFAGETAAVVVDDEPAVSLEPGLFSSWVQVRFRAGPLVSLRGMLRFLLLRNGPEPAIYASPIQIAPRTSPLPISAPRSFAGEVADRLGPMKTSGWPEDTFAANDGVLDDIQLFTDIRDSYRANERLCLDRLERSGADLLSMVFTATDRMQHMFFRYRDEQHPAHDKRRIAEFVARTGIEDPIFESYRWMNDTIAAVQAHLGSDDVLIIVSDHGFHTWRRGVNLNTWLKERGYLVLHDEAGGRRERNLDEFFRRSAETAHVDWSRTRAYAIGLGQIYLNLEGREGEGIVSPEQREELIEKIIDGLWDLVGPDGEPVFSNLYPAEDIWSGERMRDAADLQCAFADGYRVSWQTCLLGVPPRVFEDNTLPWSGDHCSNDASETPGIFLCNRRLAPSADPGLENIAPTVCRLFGAPPPAGADAPPLPLLLD